MDLFFGGLELMYFQTRNENVSVPVSVIEPSGPIDMVKDSDVLMYPPIQFEIDLITLQDEFKIRSMVLLV